VTAKKFIPSLEYLARELAPLETIPHRKVPANMTEAEALRTFFALNVPTCPLLAHMADYGFNLKTTRDFLSTFAGQTITVPSRRTLSRQWDDFQIWLAVEHRVSVGDALPVAQQKIAGKFKLPVKKVEEVYTRFRRAHQVVGHPKHGA